MAWWNPLDINPWEKGVEVAFSPKDAGSGEDQYMSGYNKGYLAGEIHQQHVDQQHVHQQQIHHQSVDTSGQHVSEGLGGVY